MGDNNQVKNSDFDLDLSIGVEAENSAARILGLDTVEVKRDLKWFKTGRLYIETSCYQISKGMYVSSGLEATKATHWVFVLGDTIVVAKTSDLKDYIDYQVRYNLAMPADCRIEPNPSKGYLITIEEFLHYQKLYKSPEIDND